MDLKKLLIVDGHGIAHPRRFGVACWLGVQTVLSVKPVFVSVGNQITLNMQLTPKYRICEPLRRADQMARAYANYI